MKHLLILSGKGGTGKTTISSAFIKLSNAMAFADCDVEAPNLHLIMNNMGKEEVSDYYGLPKAEINSDICVSCGKCKDYCKFYAVKTENNRFNIAPFSCEGCGVCEAICPVSAITMKPKVSGELKLYKDSAVFSTATLKMGSGTSGKLVTEVKRQMSENAPKTDLAVIDGSPGIGCPVIASISGVDMVLIVAEPSVSGISDMERIIKTSNQFGVSTAVCINKYDTNLQNTKKIEQFCIDNNIICLGKVPFDKNAGKAINNGLSVVDIECNAGKEIKKLFLKVLAFLYRDNGGLIK